MLINNILICYSARNRKRICDDSVLSRNSISSWHSIVLTLSIAHINTIYLRQIVLICAMERVSLSLSLSLSKTWHCICDNDFNESINIKSDAINMFFHWNYNYCYYNRSLNEWSFIPVHRNLCEHTGNELHWRNVLGFNLNICMC